MFQKVAQSKLLVPIDENSIRLIRSPCSLLTCRHLRVNMLHWFNSGSLYDQKKSVFLNSYFTNPVKAQGAFKHD
jgi:hypothetical protein